MSTPRESSPINGHGSPMERNESSEVANDVQSESDLSDVQAPDMEASSPSASPMPPIVHQAATLPRIELSSNSPPDSSEHDASEDADYDLVDTPRSGPIGAARMERTSSNESRPPARRKTGHPLEEDFIRDNPELYGLRRSSRPVQRRQVVDSDDDDDDNDLDSDIVPTGRRLAKRRRIERSQPASKNDTPARQTPVDPDDDDSDTYGGARAKSFQKKARRQQELQPSLALADKRWSSRKAAQTVGTYNESEVDEEEEAELTPNQWPVGEDNSPYMEKIIRHRIKDGLELTADATRNDFEYFVKWQGLSHLHDTWETTESVAGFRGFRRLENYYRKVVEYEQEMRFGGDDIAPEQREQWLLDREREEDALEDYTKVERVVAVRNGDMGDEYYVKWKGLLYDECTWEAASLVSEHAQDKIDQFLDRSTRSWLSDRKEASPETRSRLDERLKEQPEYIKGSPLREFQLIGLNFLALNWTRSNNVILADEMGLGKTVQTVSFFSWLRNSRGQEGPFLVVAPLSVIPAWCDTFNHWTPDLNYVVYTGPEAARANIREHELIVNGNPKKHKFNVLVTSYDYILLDHEFLRSIKWQVLAVDEAHRLKNRESQLYAKLFGFGVPCKVLITGTPIQNNLAELSALLDFLNPGKVIIDEDLEKLSRADDKQVEADEDEEKRMQTQSKLRELHTAIAPFILRRTKETVESDLPPKTEKIIRVELSDVQLDYYKNILTRNYAALTDASSGHKQSLLNIMMELKKISNHPYMFQGAEERVLGGSTRREDQIKGLITSSGKMMLLDQLLAKLKRDNHRVLIFSQMVKMLDILGDYLRIRGYQFQRLDGTIPAGPRRMAINHFNADGSDDFCFLLSTRAGGLGINLMTADTVIIYDSDWNPQADLQAMARAHRIGQKKPVSVYRLVAKQTIEEEVVKRARNKLFLEYLTIQAGVTDEGKALREQFKERGLKMDEAKTSEDIQLILKMRSQNLFEQSSNQEKLEKLDIDSILENAEVTKTDVDDKINLSSGGIDWDNWMQVTDVKLDESALDWDQIIPADQLATIKTEEENRKNEEYLAKALEENAPRKAALKAAKRSTDSDRAERLAKKRKREQEELEELEEQRALLSDPKRPLNEKETRNLIRAFFRFGSMDDRGDEVVHDARLEDRDREFLRATIDELIATSRAAMDSYSDKLRQDEEKAGKTLAKKDKKAVLIDFGEVKKVNAETVLDRPPQLKLLRERLQVHNDNRTFRLPEATKGAHYTCEWGAREDGMLLVGIDRYGFGAWTLIRDDPELDMQEKFFLEEHRVEKKEERKKGDDKSIQSPGAVHLVRRSEYLLSVLLAKYSNDAAAKKAVENHHRSKKNLINGHRREMASSVSASPAPPMAKKLSHQGRDRDRAHGHGDHHHHRSQSSVHERGTPRPEFKRRHLDEHDERGHKHRRVEEHGQRDERRTEAKHEKDPKEKDKKKLDPEALEKIRVAREKAVERFLNLSLLDDDKIDVSDNDHLIWYLLKPVRKNLKNIMYTTQDKIPNPKERAKIMGEELRRIGSHVDDIQQNQSGIPQDKLEALVPQFWDFLASIWPVGDFFVPGKRLARMYKDLTEKDKKKDEEKRALEIRKATHPDLEDGEISEREEQREPRREPRRDDWHDSRRDDRSRDDSYPRNKYYENGDRLRFDRHKSIDRGRPVHSGYGHGGSRSPRQGGY